MLRGCLCRSLVLPMRRTCDHTRRIVRRTNWGGSRKSRCARTHLVGRMSLGDLRKNCCARTRRIGQTSWGGLRESRCARSRRKSFRGWTACFRLHNCDWRRKSSCPRRKTRRQSRTRFWVGWCCAVLRSGSPDTDRCPCSASSNERAYLALREMIIDLL